jgi:hypothetical protein
VVVVDGAPPLTPSSACLHRRAELQFRNHHLTRRARGPVDRTAISPSRTSMRVSPRPQRPAELGAWSHFVDLLDLAAIAIPTGKWTNAHSRESEMSFGVTLMGPAGRDQDPRPSGPIDHDLPVRPLSPCDLLAATAQEPARLAPRTTADLVLTRQVL